MTSPHTSPHTSRRARRRARMRRVYMVRRVVSACALLGVLAGVTLSVLGASRALADAWATT